MVRFVDTLLPCVLTPPALALNFSRQVGSPADGVRGTSAGGIPNASAQGAAEEAAGLFPLGSDNTVRTCSYYNSAEYHGMDRPLDKTTRQVGRWATIMRRIVLPNETRVETRQEQDQDAHWLPSVIVHSSVGHLF